MGTVTHFIFTIVLVGLLRLVLLKKGQDYEPKKFTATVTTSEDDGECVKVIRVAGNGVKEEIKTSCQTPSVVITADNKLIVGDKIFSDKPNYLVVVNGVQCTEHYYENGKTIFQFLMPEDACAKVKKDMEEITKDLLGEEYELSGRLKEINGQSEIFASKEPISDVNTDKSEWKGIKKWFGNLFNSILNFTPVAVIRNVFSRFFK